LKNPKKWDGKWRVVVFDIPIASRIIRDAFRRKLKEFGFYAFQQSIWIYPYHCEEEVKLLREFFGLNKKQIQVLEVNKLEDDNFLRRYFNLRH
jgi:phenylacetic acid degradation operon negative regulatory protein